MGSRVKTVKRTRAQIFTMFNHLRFPGPDERMTVIIGATAASILFVVLMIVLVVIICCCRRKRNSEVDSDEFNNKKGQNMQQNNSNSYTYQYHNTPNEANVGRGHSIGNGKIAYSELDNGHSDYYR